MAVTVEDLFVVTPGHSLDLVALNETTASDPDGVAFVSRKRPNNGVQAFVSRLDDVEPALAGTLTMALGGTVASTFLQPRSYYTSYHVSILSPKQPMTDEEKLWWALCLWHNRYRYNYGRQANRTHKTLELPGSPPDWLVSVKFPDYSGLSKPTDQGVFDLGGIGKWEPFLLGSLFEIRAGRYVRAADKLPGSTPSVGGGANNNGVAAYINLPAEHPAGVISVARDGSVGSAFHQPQPFFATEAAHVFYPKSDLTTAQLLFIATLIRAERYRYNYGRKWSIDGMRMAEIRLPATSQGDPDWDRVSRLARRLDFSASIS